MSEANEMSLCFDVVQVLCDFCDLCTQIALISSCKEFNELKIRKLDCSNGIAAQITQKIIQQKKFDRLQKLNAYNNSRITSVNHLANTLIELNCAGYFCSINQEGINNLKVLQKLNAYNNSRITSVNHLANTLIELNCGRDCGINQKGINDLKVLQILNAFNNTKIISVNHLMNTLIQLDCSWNNINQEGIKELKILRKLYTSGNSKIISVTHLTNTLIEVNCRYDCGIGFEEINKFGGFIKFNCIWR